MSLFLTKVVCKGFAKGSASKTYFMRFLEILKKIDNTIFAKDFDMNKLFFVEFLYRGGLTMQGTLVIMGTRYAWNIENKGDQACLER